MSWTTLPLIAFCAVIAVGPALAQTYQNALVEELVRLGYDRIEVSRTLLGRSQILATNGDETREIVMNPRTGEILRDFSRQSNDGTISVATPIAILPLMAAEPAVSPPVAALPEAEAHLLNRKRRTSLLDPNFRRSSNCLLRSRISLPRPIPCRTKPAD